MVNAFGSIRKGPSRLLQSIPNSDHRLVRDLLYTESHLTRENLSESWHDLLQVRNEAQKMFEVGVLDLETKAAVEVLFWQIAEQIRGQLMVEECDEIPEELAELSDQLADQHICNFSVFQSLLDHWALGQVFPVIPIHRLNEEPTVNSTLVDITCDSDGKVSRFIDLADVASSLRLHHFERGESYYLGIFLTGAYQDIMGDNHNLFGRVNEVHVFLDEDEEDGFYIEEKIQGSTIGEILATMQYEPRDLVKQIKKQVDARIRSDQLKPNEGMRLLGDYRRGLQDQTYLAIS